MRAKLAIFFVLLAGALVILVVTSSTSAAQVHLKLHEFRAEADRAGLEKLASRNLTLYGKVKEGSIEREGVRARFTIVDQGIEMAVEHSGKTLLPDTFQDGADAGVEGTYDPARKVFVSHKVMAKCASRYEAPGQMNQKSY
ncbi:MAG TPA: cytochrome c maturation protein CcmE [Turneriella sp.]|nr:cytochrome c maturation protein CcmE [Turneriella sp.]HNA78588.1 cytochrome c maturation protein CcmE [Turneriella sp.]HNE19536.1 cytochrome c maturation protein CcmE [Turneriella sp.]HNJ65070.1 cytochrome c maturation protein CcmE [Turneriella sp.]HNL08938.1 cytochrome c maturation protein CcmE [Turneriella sp.]